MSENEEESKNIRSLWWFKVTNIIKVFQLEFVDCRWKGKRQTYLTIHYNLLYGSLPQ